ncbi:MAG TPA: DUF4157 domain-containing protein [Pyrinomonadaceae bacterium]|nr:DUF4157 domain-containing protein [Pyrinomonadaceae bacterium]
MRLAEESRVRLEQFFRSYERDEALHLPSLKIHAGFWSQSMTRALRVAALTLGRHVFVAREVVWRDAHGRQTIKGWLLAHETAHVRQFQRVGCVPFLYAYAREYLRLLVRGGRFDARARMKAYEQLSWEREARAAEAAYLEWRARVPLSTL